jgi:hypothetical protein
MNYYAQGGQANGIKALAQELPKYGRGGDSIVAHINPEEAMMLKAMGGSGTINPVTGLPEFIFKKIAKPFVQAAKVVQNIPGIKQVSDVATQAFKPVDQALVGLDKAVGKTIPGGWGTVAAVAASMIPGAQFATGGKLAGLGLSKSAALGGLGALTGSGILRPEGKFNLQGALVGGALAYGSAELMSGLEGAAKPTVDAAGNLTNASTTSALTGTSAGYTPSPFLSGTSIGAGQNVLTPTANALANAGEFVAPAFTGGTSSGISGLSAAAAPANFGLNAAIPAANTASIGLGNIAAKQGTMEALSSFGKDYLANVSNVGTGAKNLLTGAPGAAAGFKAAGATLSNTALPIAFGLQGLASIDEQRNFLREQQAAGNIAQAEYDAAMAEINRSEAIARDAVARNPFNSNPDRSATVGETSYERADADENLYGRFDPSERLYAKGGEVPGYFFGGSIRSLMGKMQDVTQATPAASKVGFQNLKSEGVPTSQTDSQGIGSLANAVRSAFVQSSNQPIDLGDTLYDKRSDINRIYDELMGRKYAMGGSVDDEPGMDEARGMMQGNLQKGLFGQSYAAGGEPRFLSGGGDGMSDSIKASINGTQEARLADGEFVIPADVVSHLGNGSSKAGAKRLYSMMDKVRSARTGTKRQGKQINPKQFMPV